MSGTAGVPNTFANAVTATGAQLDANYTTIVAYLNNPTNRNNFAADGAATNTVVLTFSPPVVGAYTAGLGITWKWGATNTGAVVMNANGLGNANLVNPDGTALAAGQGTQGSIGSAVYDGTRFIFLASSATPASAAQVSAAVTLVPFVSPGRMQNHPGVAKAWAYFNGTVTGTQTITSNGYNVATVTRSSAGSYTLVFSTPFANTGYCLGGISAGGVAVVENNSVARGTTSVAINVITTSTLVATDVTSVSFIVFGTQ